MPDATIVHARGPLRRACQALLRGEADADGHYLATDGGQGAMYAALEDGHLVGTCLIGKTASAAAERALVADSWRVAAIKRLYATDDAAIPESQLLRSAMRQWAATTGQTTLFVAYADPAAVDVRTGLPLLGGVYMAAGFFFAGETTSQRWVYRDPTGRIRSSRQGAITITPATMPAGWQRSRLPPARIWVAVVAPETIIQNGQAVRTSIRWQRQQRRRCWAALHPARRVAAQQWIERQAWKRLVATRRIIPLGNATGLRWPNERRPGLWQGRDLTTRAAPVWVPVRIQLRLPTLDVDETAVAHERTANRQYLALGL